MNSLDLSIIIPTINESDRLPLTLNKIISYQNNLNKFKYEIIIADDNSVDKTLEVSEKVFKNNNFSNYHLIINKDNKNGKGYCQKLGIKKAIGEYILLIDADMSVSIEYLDIFFEKIKENDYHLVCGCRTDNSTNNTITRHIIGLANNILLHLFLYQRIVPDSTCGFKLLKSIKIKNDIDRYIINTGFFEVELIYSFIKKKLPIYYYPVIWCNDNNSKIKVLKSMFIDTINIFRIKLKKFEN
tara:strand:+ start:10266 stop:10991 length:726 start_codon:yes stop_codon:yes gene_type:complete